MSKLDKTTPATLTSAVRGRELPAVTTGEGAVRDAKSELFMMAVTNMVGEFTFYESAEARDGRYASAVAEVAVEEPEWMAGFLPWLRDEANLRSASLVGALEAAKAMVDNGIPGGRRLVNSVMRRADEPGEALAYWMSTHGRRIPKPVKRGIADAVTRLYDERSLLKYDTDTSRFRFGDVIELVHPSPDPAKPEQGDLFAHALDRRHGRDNPIPKSLTTLRARAELFDTPPGWRPRRPRREIRGERFTKAAMTWEALTDWLLAPMSPEAWAAVMPSMEYTALLSNLRVFDADGVDETLARSIAARLSDPDEVATSRQLPMRLLSAYRTVPSLRWEMALTTALEHSQSNVPRLQGRSLILVDTCGNMSGRRNPADDVLMRWEAAAIFGLALARRCEAADLVSFSRNGYDSQPSHNFELRRHEPLLKGLHRWRSVYGSLDGCGDIGETVRRHYRDHDRVVIVTDRQAHPNSATDVAASVPGHRMVCVWNLGGNRNGHTPTGSGTRRTFGGGLTDAAFRLIPLLEAGRNADWPWLTAV